MYIDKKELGYRLFTLRKEKNLSMDELAKAIHVGGRSTINGWEKGRSLPPKNNLEDLSSYFGVSSNYLKYGSFQNYVFCFLAEDIWNNKDLYYELCNNLWEYTRINTNVNSEIKNFNESLPLTKTKTSTEKIGNSIKLKNVKKAVNILLPKIIKKIDFTNKYYDDYIYKKISYEDNNLIAEVSKSVIIEELSLSMNSFRGQVQLLENIITEMDNNSYFLTISKKINSSKKTKKNEYIKIKDNESYIDFLNREKSFTEKSNNPYNDFYSLKLIDELNEFLETKIKPMVNEYNKNKK